MAGGPHAQSVPCPECLARAERVYEGVEDDHYVCAEGHRFGLDWSRGMAKEPCWPPSPEEREAFARQRQMNEDP